MAASVLISRRKSCAANRPSPSCSGSVFDVAAIETPRSTSCDEQPRDQRGVAGVVEFELVDAHHHVVGQQVDALDEPENAGQLRELTERRERLSAD